MSQEEIPKLRSRRSFLKIAFGTSATAVVMAALPALARADDLPHLSDTDPSAKALGYVEDGTASKNPMYKAGNACSNCQFYSGKASGYGPCMLFPGKSVHAGGWCISYAAKKS